MNYKIDKNNSIIEYDNSVFETFLIEDGHPFFFDKHLNRLEKACNDLFDLKINKKSIKAFLYNNIPKNGKFGGRLVCSIDGCILSFRDVKYNESGFLDLSSIIRSSNDKKYLYKTNDYLERLIELNKARKSGFLDTIYLNEKGFVTSCSIANIYFIKSGIIHIPALKNGLLNGIVREVIIKSNDCIEGDYTIDDFIHSDGIFISNSLIEILKVEGIRENNIICDQKTLNKINESYYLEKEIDRRKCFG